MTGLEACRRAANALRPVSGEAARVEARRLVETVTGRADAGLLDRLDRAAVEALDELVRRRAAGEPLQYVTGVAGFRRLDLKVGPGVFIPRPETEVVVEVAIGHLPHGGTVVDLGTGSGAIALAIADERPDARVFATERSADALEWARRNRDATGLGIRLVEGDLFDGLPGDLRGEVDVVVSNPPYIAPEEAASLPDDVVGYEPHDALFAPGGGLGVMERVAHQAPRWLRPGGVLVLEIGETQSAGVTALLGRAGYADVAVRDDLVGRPRVARARWTVAG